MKYQELSLTVNIHWDGRWNMVHKRQTDGGLHLPNFFEVLHIDANKKNALMDDGENHILDVYLRGATQPTNLYFGLGNNGGTPGVPAETETLSTITEVAGTSYARIAVSCDSTGWPTLSLQSGDYRADSATKTFTAGGTWTAADYLFLASVASGTAGKLVATVALSASRVLLINDTLDVSMNVKLQ